MTTTINDFEPGRVKDILYKDDWAILTASNPHNTPCGADVNAALLRGLRRDLHNRGIRYVSVFGKYGNDEGEQQSLLLLGVTEEQALDIARDFAQESILTRKGLVYTLDEHVDRSLDIVVFDKVPENNYTRLPYFQTIFSIITR